MLQRYGVATVVLCLAIAGGAALVLGRKSSGPWSSPSIPRPSVPTAEPWVELFPGSRLDPVRWGLISDGDFQEKAVDVRDGSLRVRAATVGSRPDTIKFVGVRSAEPFRMGKGARFSVDVDWNEQQNGTYLAAQIILAPAKCDGNPLAGNDWVKIEYIGVPPGKNGRLAVGSRAAGRDGQLFTEGWPQTRREGRAISQQHIDLEIRGRSFVVKEGGVERYASRPGEGPLLDQAYLYLQLSTHSNYPPRELLFRKVEFAPLTD